MTCSKGVVMLKIAKLIFPIRKEPEPKRDEVLDQYGLPRDYSVGGDLSRRRGMEHLVREQYGDSLVQIASQPPLMHRYSRKDFSEEGLTKGKFQNQARVLFHLVDYALALEDLHAIKHNEVLKMFILNPFQEIMQKALDGDKVASAAVKFFKDLGTSIAVKHKAKDDPDVENREQLELEKAVAVRDVFRDLHKASFGKNPIRPPLEAFPALVEEKLNERSTKLLAYPNILEMIQNLATQVVNEKNTDLDAITRKIGQDSSGSAQQSRQAG